MRASQVAAYAAADQPSGDGPLIGRTGGSASGPAAAFMGIEFEENIVVFYEIHFVRSGSIAVARVPGPPFIAFSFWYSRRQGISIV